MKTADPDAAVFEELVAGGAKRRRQVYRRPPG